MERRCYSQGSPEIVICCPRLPRNWTVLHVYIENLPSGGLSAKDFITFIAAILGLVGVLLTIRSTAKRQRESFDRNAELQREADRRRHEDSLELQQAARNHDVRVARGVLFAQLSRVYRTVQGQYIHIEKAPLTFMWLPLYETLLPSAQNLARVEPLSAAEVVDVTAFLYSYQENMGYIGALTNAKGSTAVHFDYQMVGVDFQTAGRELKWLTEAMRVIERKAQAAMRTIRLEATREYGASDPLSKKFVQIARRNAMKAREAGGARAAIKSRIKNAVEVAA
jgi:hypothetical protein